MRIVREKAIFIAIDYQEKLMPAIEHHEKIMKKTDFLMQGLKLLEVPMIMTTQYAKGLGFNMPGVRQMIGDDNNFDKVTFSIYQDEKVKEFLDKSGFQYIIVGGAEAHICVLQSLIDLAEAGYIPVLVTDCIGSRHQADYEMAIERAKQEGVILTSAEAILYELMESAKNPVFKEFTALVKAQGQVKKNKI